MTDFQMSQLSLDELCLATQSPSEMIIEIVELGIIEPQGETPESWVFNTQMLMTAQRAFRLHDDLEIDWPGIALAVSLIDEMEHLKSENQRLQQRLQRFIEPS